MVSHKRHYVKWEENPTVFGAFITAFILNKFKLIYILSNHCFFILIKNKIIAEIKGKIDK